MSASAQLRAALANVLAEDGTLTDPAWRGAAEAVPRELFVGSYFAQVPDSLPTRYRPVRRGEERPSLIDPAVIGTWTGGWVAQLAAPAAERMGAGPEQILWDVSTGSQARTAPGPDGGWTVVQRGPVRLWDRVEAAIRLWQAAGEPHQEGFGVTVSAAS